MTIFQIIAILVTLAATFSYLNYRLLKLPTTIGLMLISLTFSLILMSLDFFGFELQEKSTQILDNIDFSQTLMQGMLSFLLFAGALHVNLSNLIEHKWTIAILATIGVGISTFLIGALMYLGLSWIGLSLSPIYCFILGAIVSPTDPIAVLALLKQAGIPSSLKTKIVGESLFNDGVGVVIFLVLYKMMASQQSFDPAHIGLLLFEEVIGGILLGLSLGGLTFWLLRTVNNYQLEILLTLSLVTGGYALASSLHVSGPLAIVAAGVLIGNHGRHLAMSESTRQHLDTFWELVDEILNAILFVLIGLEVLNLTVQSQYVFSALLAIPIVLVARFFSVGFPLTLLRLKKSFSPHVVKILTWGGLRGGISIALALSLPMGQKRDLILIITYAIVIFSILVQGLTIPYLLKKTIVQEHNP